MNSNFHGDFRHVWEVESARRGLQSRRPRARTRAGASYSSYPRTRFTMCKAEELRERERFMAAWRAARPERLAAMMKPLAAREIETALDLVPPQFFPAGDDGFEDRFEFAVVTALRSKGIAPYDVLKAAPDGTMRPDYFQADKCLRGPEYSFI